MERSDPNARRQPQPRPIKIPMLDLKAFCYVYHQFAYGQIHNNPAKCVSRYHNVCGSSN